MHKLKSAIVFLFILFSVLFFAITTTQAALAPGNTTPKKGVGFSGGTAEQMKALGVSWAYSWYPARAHFNSVYEHVPMVSVAGSAGDSTYTQAELTNFAGIARDFPGSYWLIWNEPDYYYQANIKAPVAAKIYKPLRDAIKAADSTAKFIVGGIYYIDTTWLNTFRSEYKNLYGVYPPLNGYHIHNYMGRTDYTTDSWRYKITFIHNWMNGNGEGSKELWLTEFPCLNCYDNLSTIMAEQVPWLEQQTWLTRYAWYATYSAGEYCPNCTGTLFTSDGGLNDLGKQYATYGNPPDTSAPTVPTNLAATVASTTQINLSWTASTDNVGVTGYKIFRCTGSSCTPSTQLTTATSTFYSNTGLSANTVYIYAISAYDAASNESAKSASVSTSTLAIIDTTPPVISITSPTSGSSASSTITVSVNASDNVGVAGVQFKLDGTNLGAEDTTSPYSIIWDTTTASNGSHTLTATARDAAGNQTTSSAIAVTVNNIDTTPPAAPSGVTVN